MAVRDVARWLGVAHAGAANQATDRHPYARCRAHEECQGVRRNARSTGVATGSDHRGVLAVLPGSLRHSPRPDLLHGLSVRPRTLRPRTSRRHASRPRSGARLEVAERSALNLKPLLVLRSNGRVKASWDVPSERAAEGRALADALGWAATPATPRIVQSLGNAQRF